MRREEFQRCRGDHWCIEVLFQDSRVPGLHQAGEHYDIWVCESPVVEFDSRPQSAIKSVAQEPNAGATVP
jgi:hypothetical protein